METQTSADLQGQSSRTLATWISFSYLAVWAYVLYGLGTATPYLRTDLRLTDFEAGLHASALAVGVLASGIGADRVARRIGTGWLADLAVAVAVGGLALIVLAPDLWVSLAGALLLGVGGGTLGTDVNVKLSNSGGSQTRRLMGQANAISMITAAAAPLAIGLAASQLHAWRAALLIPAFAFLGLSLIRPRETEPGSAFRAPQSRLPRAYWLAWLLIVLVVSIEFSFVFWGSTIVGKRTGISNADATLLASLFVVGMFVGRAAIGRGLGAGRQPHILLAAGLLIAAAGASLTWVSTVPLLSGVGLLLGGLGTAGLFPIGLTVALQTSPRARLQAAARTTLGSGLAVLLAPSTLGLAADTVGVVAAWPIVLGLALGGLVVLAATPRAA
ncbi:MAG: MFS transporter [Candidatus Limnocylindrales bacterium]